MNGKSVHHYHMHEDRPLHRRRVQTRRKGVCIGAVVALTIVFGSMAAVPALAGDTINCTCVANGTRVELGRLFCIKTSSGKEFLARCERVLNNTSWKRIQDDCPTAYNWSQSTGAPLS